METDKNYKELEEETEKAIELIQKFKEPPHSNQFLSEKTAISCAIIYCDGMIDQTAKKFWYRVRSVLYDYQEQFIK
jgi:hypothetical protein